jgi:hypothetical protein
MMDQTAVIFVSWTEDSPSGATEAVRTLGEGLSTKNKAASLTISYKNIVLRKY